MKINIKDKMKEKGLNKHRLSILVGISYQSMCKIYDGKTDRIYLSTLGKLCEVLECTPNDIIIIENK